MSYQTCDLVAYFSTSNIPMPLPKLFEDEDCPRLFSVISKDINQDGKIDLIVDAIHESSVFGMIIRVVIDRK